LVSIGEFVAQSTLLPLTPVSDGLGCFTVAAELGAAHDRTVTGDGKASVELEHFRAVNAILGNSRVLCHWARRTATARTLAVVHAGRFGPLERREGCHWAGSCHNDWAGHHAKPQEQCTIWLFIRNQVVTSCR
jgi:hypothetical protein